MLRLLLLLTAFLLAAPAAAQIPVEGRLLGADGRPMPRAHVVVERGPADTSFVAAADADGRFAFTLERTGGYGLYLTGARHETLTLPLVVTDRHRPVRLDVRLAARAYAAAPDTVWVVRPGTDALDVPMTRRADGTFAARLPAPADTLAYQLFGVTETPWQSSPLIAGTEADRLAFLSRGPFWISDDVYLAVVDAPEDSVTLVYDPALLPRGPETPAIEADPAEVGEIARIYVDVEARERRIGLEGPSAEVVAREQAPVRERLAAEPPGLVRQWLLLRFFDEMMPGPADSLLARQALAEVPPTSPLWSFEAWSDVGASNLLARLDRYAADAGAVRAYVDHGLNAHEDPAVRAHFLYAGAVMADADGDETRRRRYYERLRLDYPQTRQYEWLRRRFDYERGVRPGRPVPAFAFTALGDASTVYASGDLRGTVYLLDFWGTWCAPCIAEMPTMHAAYERFGPKGFEILSLALLDTEEAVDAFREARYPMPWLHALVSREIDYDVRTRFEITGVPRPILVDASGTIVAIDGALRGEKLLEVLEGLFGRE